MFLLNNIPGDPSPYWVLWKTLGHRGGPNTAQKRSKIGPKEPPKGEIFWLIPQSKHRTRGLSPYGDLWGTLGYRGGPKIAKTSPKKQILKANKKRKIENNS